MIAEELINLKNEFKRIKDMGYVKATSNGLVGIEKTFEDLLDKDDFSNIEIKAKGECTNKYITLFGAAPLGKKEFEIERLRKSYGYVDQVYKHQKLLHVSVQANCSSMVGSRYLFKLIVDYEEQKVFLLVTDKNMNFVEKKAYWTFETLKDNLEHRSHYMALVKAWSNIIDGDIYYKYYDLDFYKLKDFKEFLKLIEDGTVRITFKIDIIKRGLRAGELNDRGVSFDIQEIDILKLFDKIKV